MTPLRIRRGLDPSDLERLATAGVSEVVAARTILPLDGPSVVVVVEGYFRIFRHAAFVRDVTLGLAARGDVLAPGAAFGDKSAESGAQALCASRVLRLSAEGWRACAAQDPDIDLKLAAVTARRLIRLGQKLEQFSRAGVEARLASTLLELAQDFGTPESSGTRLDLPLSQENLARLAGTIRETCSSVMADFSRRGLVRGSRVRGLLILDQPGLAALI